MPRTVRCTSAVFGSTNINESLRALAMTRDFSSGVRYRWCGSLPVGMRRVSCQLVGSITLTLASSEFITKMGLDKAWAAKGARVAKDRTKAEDKRAGRLARKRSQNVTTNHSLGNLQV